MVFTHQDHRDFFYIQQALNNSKKGCPKHTDQQSFAKYKEWLELMYKYMALEFQKSNKLAQAIKGANHVYA